jgi:hypothetical protein
VESEFINFQDFKRLTLIIFGMNLYQLTIIEIDSILRKTYRNIIVKNEAVTEP